MLLVLAAQALFVCQTVRRLHDIGGPGTHGWLLLIPFYSAYLWLALLLKEGDLAPNCYGANPLSTNAQLATIYLGFRCGGYVRRAICSLMRLHRMQ